MGALALTADLRLTASPGLGRDVVLHSRPEPDPKEDAMNDALFVADKWLVAIFVVSAAVGFALVLAALATRPRHG